MQQDITPQPAAEVIVVEVAMDFTSAMGGHVNPPGGPDLSREGPFDVYDPMSGPAPWVLDSLPGCQYRMTSYDVSDVRSDMDSVYGIHLHDPRMMEYMGAPESARLLSRTPEYLLQHMGCGKTLAEALQLQHDASLIMTNVQDLAQFVTSLNRMASEMMRVAFDREPFPMEAV